MEFMQSAQSTSLKGKGKPTVTVEDAPDEEDSIASEPQEEFAPGNDADYFVEEDEDGRFFGGGLTKEQKDILTIFEDAGGEGVIGDVSLSSLNNATKSHADKEVSIRWKNFPCLPFDDLYSDSSEPLTKTKINDQSILMTPPNSSIRRQIWMLLSSL